MSRPTEKLDIVVGPFPTDAALYNINGVRTLFMGEGQTFTRAVSNLRNVLPGITIEAAERMIREQCPEFVDLDDMLGLSAPACPSVERPPAAPADDEATKEQYQGTRRRKAFLVAALLPALAASWALGRYTNVANTGPVQTKASAPAATPHADPTVEDAPFNDDKFGFFSDASNIDCDPVSPLEAECTDTDGMVMSTKAATGPDSTIFTFSYGSEQIGLRIFYDADYAHTWARQDGSRQMYQHMKVYGRYVLWGTDPQRIGEYVKLLKQADHATPAPMGRATPLPPRLAALTLGTLGLDRQAVNHIFAEPAVASIDAPAMIAARLVLGLDTAPVYGGHDGDDIVALAMGIEPPVSRGSGGTGGVLVTDPTPAPQTPTQPPTTTPAPSPTTPAPPTTSPAPPTGPTTPTTTDPSTPTQPTTPTAPPSTSTPPPANTTPPPPENTTPPPTSPPPPSDPAPTPSQPEPPETSTPPVDETPEPPADGTPTTPPEDNPSSPGTADGGGAPTGQEPAAPDGTADQDDDSGDLLILDSAWTVPVAPAA